LTQAQSVGRARDGEGRLKGLNAEGHDHERLDDLSTSLCAHSICPIAIFITHIPADDLRIELEPRVALAFIPNHPMKGRPQPLALNLGASASTLNFDLTESGTFVQGDVRIGRGGTQIAGAEVGGRSSRPNTAPDSSRPSTGSYGGFSHVQQDLVEFDIQLHDLTVMHVIGRGQVGCGGVYLARLFGSFLPHYTYVYDTISLPPFLLFTTRSISGMSPPISRRVWRAWPSTK
jgi:hypothetical protein